MTFPSVSRLGLSLGLLALLTPACDDPEIVEPVEDAAPARCSSDDDCDDDLFCTGVERCVPTATGADARGCVAVAAPCMPTQECDESDARCVTLCALVADADGDGDDSTDCGGEDCDDADPRRAPSKTEICDDRDLDEDCDPSTFGELDADHDGDVSSRCCNAATCGPDCDDSRPGVNRSASEVCNDRDDDCDDQIDEESRVVFYRDLDGDLYGRGDETIEDCSAPSGYSLVAGDCDDTRPNVHPGLVEICDGLDNDCSGEPDGAGEDDDGDGVVSEACGGTDCRDDVATVFPGATETCDGYDTDCNGELDGPSEDVDGDGFASCGPAPLDCIDTEARTGACIAPLGCESPVCACEITLPHTWYGVDLDSGRVVGTSATGDTTPIDLGTDTGSPIGLLRVYNGARHQLGNSTWWSSSTAGMLGAMGATIPLASGQFYLVESNRGYLYRVGYAAQTGSGTTLGARFFYAPVLDAPASFACPP